MVGSTGPRVLAATLPHVDVWNTWYDWYGNTPDGFEARNREIDEAVVHAGRRPEDVERSACVLVVLDRAAGERSHEDIAPLEGSMERVAAGLRDLQDAGANEAIVVADPITEGSIRALGEALEILRG
jgi:alkanesulfonate monooxygenase SsuD/methylene tetrahydromethanopterin reductase-like flavin-dependent oxidoreductase (luciferase family)